MTLERADLTDLTNGWHHIALSYAGASATMKYWRDGVFQNSLVGTLHSLNNVSDSLTMGGAADDPVGSIAGLDDVYWFGRALATAEVQVLYGLTD